MCSPKPTPRSPPASFLTPPRTHAPPHCIPISTPRLVRLLRPLRGNLASFKRVLRTHPSILRTSARTPHAGLVTYAKRGRSKQPAPGAFSDWPMPLRQTIHAIQDSFGVILKATWSPHPLPQPVLPLKYLAAFQLGDDMGRASVGAESPPATPRSRAPAEGDVATVPSETAPQTHAVEETEVEEWYRQIPKHLRGAVLLQHSTSLCALHPYVYTMILDLLQQCVHQNCGPQFLYLVKSVVFAHPVTLETLVAIEKSASALNLAGSYFQLLAHALPLPDSDHVYLQYATALPDPILQLRLAAACLLTRPTWHPLYLSLAPHLATVPPTFAADFAARFPTSPIQFLHFHCAPTEVALPTGLDVSELFAHLPLLYLKKLARSLQEYHYFEYCSELVNLLVDEVDDLSLTQWAIQLEQRRERSPRLTPDSFDFEDDEDADDAEAEDEEEKAEAEVEEEDLVDELAVQAQSIDSSILRSFTKTSLRKSWNDLTEIDEFII